jgi:hypothetical protein
MNGRRAGNGPGKLVNMLRAAAEIGASGDHQNALDRPAPLGIVLGNCAAGCNHCCYKEAA